MAARINPSLSNNPGLSFSYHHNLQFSGIFVRFLLSVSLFLLPACGKIAENSSSSSDSASAAPTILDITSTAANGMYRAQSVPITVTFSESVVVTGTPQISLNSGGTANYSSGSGSATLTFSYTAAASNVAELLDLASTSSISLNGGTIKNASGTSAVLTAVISPSSGALAVNKAIEIIQLVSEQWRWFSGRNTIGESSVYGTQGQANSANLPGARSGFAIAKDSSGNVWIFGGDGVDSASTTGSLADLWKFDGKKWTWVSGTTLANQNGVYGTKGTPDAANYPGGRGNSAMWVDSSGNVWLFGGLGYAGSGGSGYLGDLWKFNGSQWTWIAGNSTIGGGANYGTINVTASTNHPGTRYSMAYWLGANNELLLFGGTVNGGGNNANDVWKFDGTDWTWISGTNAYNQAAVWGTQGVADAANMPNGRRYPTFCSDSSNNLWVFGGNTSIGRMNDLWKFNGSQWTWVSGGQTGNAAGVYGTKGVSHVSNVPGARSVGSCVVDSSSHFWLLTGFNGSGNFNDLWKFDGTLWTWKSGSSSSTGDQPTYGTLNTANSLNTIGSRSGSGAWIDSKDRIWLLGGNGLDSTGASGNLSEIFRFDP